MTAAYGFFNIGIYSIPQAARLTGIPTQRVRRWMRGYHYHHAGERRRSGPVITGELPPIDGHVAMGFLDLLELRFVDAFLRYVSMKAIRHAAERAAQLFNDQHPFAAERFHTDGKRIFAEIASQASGDKALLDLKDDQLGFYDVIRPSLRTGIFFDGAGRALLWQPHVELPEVVLDPTREFGQPIINLVGIQTVVIDAAYKAERSVERVAKWFDARPGEVEQAVRFELKAA